jgi:NitT/TauT family transport system substrate-binding protein
MRRARLAAASLAAIATFAALEACRAEDQLKIAVGGRGIGETFVTEVGDKAGLFKRHNLALDIFYTDGGGETQQAVISNSAQVGVASGFLGAIGVFAKGAPVRIIGGSYTGGSQVFWYVPADSPIRSPQDLSGKTVAYSNNGSSTHAGVLALQRRRALQEFLPPAAVDPDRMSGIEEVMADAINFKFITAPLSKGDLAELIQIPERQR